MQILEYCTLLQACEFLAFGWEPFCEEDEMFLGDRNRIYMNKNRICPDTTGGLADPILDEKLGKLDRAKIRLRILFNAGLKCIIGNKATELPKIPVKDQFGFFISLGTPYDNCPGYYNDDGHLFPDQEDGVQYLYVTDEITGGIVRYSDVKINFYEMQEAYKEYAEIKLVEAHTFKLFISGNKLCCQKDDEPHVELHTLSNGAKNTLILEYIMNNPDHTITKQELIQNAGSANFTTADTISNTLQTLFNKLPNIKTAFFPVVSCTEILFKSSVTNRELYENGLPNPI